MVLLCLTLLAIALDESVRRAIMSQLRLSGALQFWNDAVRQYLAQFNAPLIKGIDIPDGALYEDFVFVESNNLAQHVGGQARGQDGVGWMIPFKGAMCYLEGWYTISSDLFSSLAEGEGLGLRKEVCHQEIMMGFDWIERLTEANEVCWD